MAHLQLVYNLNTMVITTAVVYHGTTVVKADFSEKFSYNFVLLKFI